MFVTTSNNLKITQWPSFENVDVYNVGDGEIISASWSKNNSFMIYLERNGRPHIISLKDRKNIKVIHIITAIDYATKSMFSRSRNGTVAVGTSLGTVALYDTHSKSIMKLYDVPGPVVDMDFNCNDKYLGVICKTGQMMILDLSNHKRVFNTDLQESPAEIRFHPNYSDMFGISTSNGKFIYMNVNQNEPVWAVTVTGGKSLNAFAFCPKLDRHQVITVDDEYKVSTFETRTGKCLFRCSLPSALTAVDFTNDGKFYAVATDKGKVCVFDAFNARTPLSVFDLHESHKIHCLRFANAIAPGDKPLIHKNTYPTLSYTSDTIGSSLKQTINGTEISPETLQSLLSQEAVTSVLQDIKDDVASNINRHIVYLNAHVQNQLHSFDDFIRKEFDKIEAQIQEKWNVVKVMRASVKVESMLAPQNIDSEDDIDEDLLEEDLTSRATQNDIVVIAMDEE